MDLCMKKLRMRRLNKRSDKDLSFVRLIQISVSLLAFKIYLTM
jgi:hypothetical protein